MNRTNDILRQIDRIADKAARHGAGHEDTATEKRCLLALLGVTFAKESPLSGVVLDRNEMVPVGTPDPRD